MSATPTVECLPGHVTYLSAMLADNAATLHGIANPWCGGLAPFPCGDHFHVGHTSPEVGNRCKAACDEAREARRRQGRR